MYTYCKNLIAQCVGCKLVNAQDALVKELVYDFLLDGRMKVLHIDEYSVGSNINFAGDKEFLIAACGMCTFAVSEPVSTTNSTIYARALLMIMLQFSLAHTIVLDKDSTLYATFSQTCQLMNLNVHTVSSDKHVPMVVERINIYLNKGMKIFIQERGTPGVSQEAILLLIYGWNSYHVPMTDITCSMIVYGREFTFPIDFSHETVIRLTSNKQWAETYAANQAWLLLHSCEVASLLIGETCSYHREKMNKLKPDPL